MKTNCWLILGTMLATSAVAQVNNQSALPATPPPAATAPAPPAPAPMTTMTAPSDSTVTTNAPAKKAVKAKKKSLKKAKAKAKHEDKALKAEKAEKAEKAGKATEKLTAKEEEKKALEASIPPVTLVPGPATVVGETVNLRGQAGLKGEVVGHVKKGDTVTVLAEINLDKPKTGEPDHWVKIALPANEKVWINASYVDATNHVISAKKLNLRGGPGENFSVLGVVEKGVSVTPVTTKDGWMQIETPPNAFAFIAAGLLKQDSAPVAEKPEMPVLPPTPTVVEDAPVIAPPAANPPPVVTPVAPAPVAPPAPLTLMSMPTPVPMLVPDNDTNLPPRVVTHEGSVRNSVSPVAPSYFELYDPASDKAIDYLYTTDTNLIVARYNGLHITVTGVEEMDPRWKDTPVITIQQINVLSAPKKNGAQAKP